MPYIKSHQISLFISMAKSSSLSMPTGEDLAFLRQEHGVELTQDHLKGEHANQHEHDFSVFVFKIVNYYISYSEEKTLTFLIIKVLVIISLTSWQMLRCISFHVPQPSPLVVIVKHYANKGQGTSGKANIITNTLLPSSFQ